VEVTLLGTGAPLSPGRATTGMVVTAPGCGPLLIDTCGGFEVARQLHTCGFKLADLRAVIVTHRHLDHAGGMPALLLANLPLDVYATDDTHAGIAEVKAGCFPEWQRHREVIDHEVAAGDRREIAGFAVEFFRMEHRVETVAVRVTHGGKTLAFSADSLPCAQLVACARGADLFICDAICAASDGEQWVQRARALMHPTAREAAEMATQAGAGTLALVHIGRFGNPDNIREEASARFAGAVAVPDDGARLTL
jgi:ribonuclease BN (tRNA processing enzyme)